jgi:hypothetical protein
MMVVIRDVSETNGVFPGLVPDNSMLNVNLLLDRFNGISGYRPAPVITKKKCSGVGSFSDHIRIHGRI